MKELAGALLNVDITKFMGRGMEKNVLILQKEREKNELLLLKMLEEGLHAGITLTARGGSMKAHPCVLSAASPVFMAMFEHEMREQLSSTVDILDISIEGLQLLFHVLYTINEHINYDSNNYDELPWLFSDGIFEYHDEFFKALLKYQAFGRPFQIRLLEHALARDLTPNNCWEYYDISVQFNEEDNIVSSIVCVYIIENFEAVVQSEEFLWEMRRNHDRVYSILKDGISF